MFAAGGGPTRNDFWLSWRKERRQHVSSGTMAHAALALGDLEEAFSWADKAVQERDPNLLWVIREPGFPNCCGRTSATTISCDG